MRTKESINKLALSKIKEYARVQEGPMSGDPNRIELVFSDWNAGWRYGFQEYGALSPYEWSKPFLSREDAEREGLVALNKEKSKRGVQ